ncbi:MAG: hypothetical protein AAF502_18815 [Bacteroidota bacterium]
MKTTLVLFFSMTLVLSIVMPMQAQKTLVEGAVSYVVTEVSGDGMEAAMMRGSEQTFFFSDDYQKMDVQLLNGSVHVQVISENNGNNSLVMMDGLMGKVMVRSDESSAKNNMVIPNYEITYNKNDKRKIAGFDCHKATLIAPDGSIFIFYVTDQIKPKNSFVQKMFKGLIGFPLEYTLNREGLKLTYKAQNVIDEYDKGVFNPTTQGFKEVTPDQWQKMFGKLDLGM